MSTRPKTIKVALISFEFVEVCVPIANALADRAVVLLMLPRAAVQPFGDAVDRRVNLVPFVKPRLRQALRQLRMCRAILREIARFDPDVVHLQQGHLWFNLALPLLRRRPLVVEIHDHTLHPGDAESARTPQALMNLAFRRADQTILHAERLREEAIQRRDLDPRATHVVPHVAIDCAPAQATVTRDAHTILFFGRIWPYKGLEWLIRAEPLVAERLPDIRIIIAGGGESLARYRELMRDPSRYEIHEGFVSTELRAQLFMRAAVVVLPYVEASQSGVVPVAYAYETPVVATSVGGLPEAVDDGVTGYLVPPRDEHALAAAIVKLLAEPKLCRQMGEAASRKLRLQWSADAVAKQLMPIYELARAKNDSR